ncbi:MAG TPA: hypothetical protein VMT64_12465 [Candidatus Binataceae bacterium]|nr:hypothetical protein [Candidatus Binataceae bacterium]
MSAYRDVRGVCGPLEFLAILTLMCLRTSLPWYAGFVMPDIFTPMMVIGIFLLAFCRDGLSRWEMAFVIPVTLAATMIHYSTPPVAIGLLLAGFGWRLLNVHRATMPRLILPAVLVGVGLAAIVLSNYLVLVAAYSPAGYAFAFARLIADGPAVAIRANTVRPGTMSHAPIFRRCPPTATSFYGERRRICSRRSAF